MELRYSGVQLPGFVTSQSWASVPVYAEDGKTLLHYRVTATIIVEPPPEPNFVVGEGD